ISSSKLMMRPVILSRPEKVAFLLVTLVDGGSLTTSSPGCRLAGVCGTPFGWRCPGGNPGNGLVPGGALATPGPAGGPPGCGGATAIPGCCPCGAMVVPGGGASGCDCTEPGGGTPCVGGGRFGVGNRRPRGSSGTCSSSSAGACCCWPRGIAPGGRNG